MQIIRYNKEYKQDWDKFVDSSKNGTFLLKRDFMEYHADRFEDCSFLFMDKNKILAIIPGNIDTKKRIFYSHQGLTYGGFILSYEISAAKVLFFLEELLKELKSIYNIRQFIYKCVPSIYHKYPSEEDLYALFRNNAQIIERKISSAIKLSCPLPFKQSRKEGIVKARKEKLTIVETTNFSPFWEILTDALINRHQARPVHSIEEIILLKNRFPKEIQLFEVRKENKIIAGCIVFETIKCIHIQYIAANECGKRAGALDYLFDYLINLYYIKSDYFDFGTSVEQGGLILNEGLIFQKEGFGGRGIMYDTYLIDKL